MNPDGSDNHPVLGAAAVTVDYPQRCADEDRIVFVRSNRAGASSQWIADADGSHLSRLTADLRWDPGCYGTWRPPFALWPCRSNTCFRAASDWR